MAKLQIYPRTHVEWAEAADAPGEISEFDDAHITINGDRMVIARVGETGRHDTIDTLSEISVKGSGERTTVVGHSQFMMDHIGLPKEEAEVAVVFDGSDSKCLI